MNLRRAAVVTMIAAAAFLSACGGGDDDNGGTEGSSDAVAQVEAVSEQLSTAYTSGDAQGICDLFRPSQLQDQIPEGKECAPVLEKALKAEKRKIKPFRIDEVVEGDGGYIVTYKDSPPGQIAFSEEGGKWYVDVSGEIQGVDSATE